MDNRDTCCLKNRKRMEADTVWQWRIMHVKKYSRSPEPFHYSHKMGLDFNLASTTQKKLDSQLLTNGVILEVCDFAKTVNKSKRHFITNILQNNFDLRFENEQQRTNFTAQIQHELKDLIGKSPKDTHEVFTLFDTSSVPECSSNKASTEHQCDGFLEEMEEDDDDSELEDLFKSSQTPSVKTKEEMDGRHVDDKHETEFSETQLTEEDKEDVLPPSFPRCEEIGLNLDVGSKQSLEPRLLTNGVMLELEDITRILTASYSSIVLSVLEHNFELDLKSQRGRDEVWFMISQLLRRRKRLSTAGIKLTQEFKGELFFSHINSLKRVHGPEQSNTESPLHEKEEVTKRRRFPLKCKQKKRVSSKTSEHITKRHKRQESKELVKNMLSHPTALCTSQTAEGDFNYMCPIEADDITDSEISGNEDPCRNPTSSDIPRELLSSCVVALKRLPTTTDGSSYLPNINVDMNPPFASQPDKSRLPGHTEQTPIPTNVLNECDMEPEEMGTESDLWKLRANRVKQILLERDKRFYLLATSRKVQLHFNVGFEPKQNISADHLTDFVLLKVARFALDMSSSQQEFIMEILENNFDLGLQSKYQKHAFECELISRVRQLRNCEDAVKFSREVFELPNSMSPIDMTHQRMGSVKPELSRLSRMRPCDVAATCALDSPAKAISKNSVDCYPFCKEIGLNLNVNSSQENKLDVNKLTKGAMTEVINFAERLCGTFEQICIDILRHNFDLDLPSVDSDLARNILAYIPAAIEQRNLVTSGIHVKSKPKRNYDSILTKLHCQNKSHLEACSSGSTQATVDQNVSKSTSTKQKSDPKSLLWKLRANHIQQILSAPHGEDCPLYSYSRCKKLGIDFNVASGVKQNLDPKLLTNGIMVEINTFATELLSAAKHFSTEILEYNFDLNLNSELYRSAFADEIARKIVQMRQKQDYRFQTNMLFELPDSRCLEGYSPSCLKCYQDRNYDLRQDVSDSGLMFPGHPHAMTDIVSVDENCTAQNLVKDPTSISQTSEEMLTSSYHHCKKIGLSLCVDKDHPRDKLDTHVLTYAVMSEVNSFAKKLCGKKIQIMKDILEHNFNLDIQDQQLHFGYLFSKLPLNPGESTWFTEVFVFHQLSHKDPAVGSESKELNGLLRSESEETFGKIQPEMQTKKESAMLQRQVPKRVEENMLSHHVALCGSQREEDDLNYMCPVESDNMPDSENSGNEDCSEYPTSSDILRESLPSGVGVLQPSFIATDGSYSLPTVNVDVDLPSATHSDKSGLQGDKEKTEIPTNVLNEYDMPEKEMGTESNLWKLRANRVKQILLVLDKQCRWLGNINKALEFNVGFEPEPNISANYLTDSVLVKVARFALDMSSSQQEFIMEILENNFDLGLQSKYQKHAFECELISRVRQLRNCEDAVKFSREVFELPNSMSPIDMTHQRMGSVKPELSRLSRMRPCDVAATCALDSPAEAISKNSVDCYPFCKEIGLNLNVNSSQENKLDVNKLTKGAMTEVINFAETLCGTFEQICIDILRHNFDLDLPSVDSDLARNILAYIPAAIEQRNLVTSGIHVKSKPKRNYDSILTKLHCQNKSHLEACSSGSTQATVDQNVSKSTSTKQKNDPRSLLWKLRPNHIQQILSAPHGENCPLYSYSRCKKLGIDFNVASGVKQNLDPKLLTNGIMVEIYTFATELMSDAKHFATEILEYNFDLNLNSELYRSAFADELGRQIAEMKKKRFSVSQKKALFELPDLRCFEEYNPHCLKCYQDRNSKLCQDVSDSGLMLPGHPHAMTDIVSVDENCTAQNLVKNSTSISQTSEEMLTSSYLHCKKIGLSLCVDKDHPRDKLDTHVLTYAVMSEVNSFAKKLCGKKIQIMKDILEHNFNLDIQDQQLHFGYLFSKLPLNPGESTWFTEVFVFHKLSHKDPAVGSESKELNGLLRSESEETFGKIQPEMQTKKESAMLQRQVPKRVEENMLSHHVALCGSQREEDDLNYMCPVESDNMPDSENSGNEDCSEYPTSSDILRESLPSGVGVLQPSFIATDGSYSLPTVNVDVDLPSATHSDKSGLQGDKEKTEIPTNVLNEYDMPEKEMGTESNLWKLRANRVKQILLVLDKQCRWLGNINKALEFNVGFEPKPNISVDYLTDSVLVKVARFALDMSSSQQEFIMEILENNFDLGLQSKYQKHAFECELISRVRQLRNCEDAVKFSREVFELPNSMSPIDMTHQRMGSVKPELDRLSRMRPCDVAATCALDSPAKAISKNSVDCYPFCKEIGLNLNVNSSQENKLDVNKLTKGAMTEVINFAETLCGTFEQICIDILRHNFDLDLPSVDSDLARNILAYIPAAIEQRNLVTSGIHVKSKPKRNYDSILTKLHCQNKSHLEACSSGSTQATVDQNVSKSTSTKQKSDPKSLLWKLRPHHIQQILSAPHGEDCPLYSYSRCKKLGIDFNVASGVKHNLDPKLLTNGIMMEIYTFATELMSDAKHFATEILEYNFDLNLNSELYRSAFADELGRQIAEMKKKRFSVSQKKALFELPDLRCLEEYNPHCLKCYQDRNSKLCQDVSDSGLMLPGHPHAMTDIVSVDENCTAQKPAKNPTFISQTSKKMLTSSYLHCKKIGLSLCVDKDHPRDKLDTHVLTYAVMSEVNSFAKKLCGKKIQIMKDILEHNFNLDIQDQQLHLGYVFSKLPLNPGESTWFTEVFVFHQPSHKDPAVRSNWTELNDMQRSERKERFRKRKLEMQAKKEGDMLQTQESKQLCTSQTAGGDFNCMCPVEADKITDSEESGNEDHLRNPTSSDIPKKSLSSCVVVLKPLPPTTNGSYILPNVNADMDPPLSRQPDKSGLHAETEQTQIPTNLPNECDMEEEEMTTKGNIWKLRANRVKQILVRDKPFYLIRKKKKIRTEFNVGFGPKQNLSADRLTGFVLLKIVRFALDMSSSQQEFIMEILENNFDLGLQSKYHKHRFACELMKRITQLKNCEDAVKFSREVFELPNSMSSIDMTHQRMGSVKPELSRLSRMRPCDVAATCALDSPAEAKLALNAETKPHLQPETNFQKSADPYAFCKEIDLKLHVKNSQGNMKLDVNKLTKGAMTEVINFAEKLCGTFEQICIDIIRHNFDLDLPSVDSDLAGNIFAYIPVAIAQRNLATDVPISCRRRKGYHRSIFAKLLCQNEANLTACSSGSTQTTVDQNVSKSTSTEQNDDSNSLLWKLRANHIQQILSAPHREDCPLYSYSRCKKLGIDFNVASGVRQNLDPKLLTNGIMVEIYHFATELLSSAKHFATEILEYNFDLNLNSEMYRSAFADELYRKISQLMQNKSFRNQTKALFELPDSRCLEEYNPPCLKCYQDRNSKLDVSDTGHTPHVHPHAITNIVSVHAQSAAKDPTSIFQPSEETVTSCYRHRHCKKIGLSLFVDKDHPKDKLDINLLTCAVMSEVYWFAKKLCGTKVRIFNDILEHNFNLDTQNQQIHPSFLFTRTPPNAGEPAWFSEVFVMYQPSHKDPTVGSKSKEQNVIKSSERKETFRKRQLEMQTKKEIAVLRSVDSGAKRLKKNEGAREHLFPICNEIGLDLDVTSKSGDKEKLDLNLLTTSVVLEMHKFASYKARHYLPNTLYEILDYNFDLSSQHPRCWEFTIATASKISAFVKTWRNNPHRRVEKVFKLPFFINPMSSERSTQQQNKNRGNSSSEEPHRQTNEQSWFDDESSLFPADYWMEMEMNDSPMRAGCDSLLHGNIQIKQEEYDPYYADMSLELDTDEEYHPNCDPFQHSSLPAAQVSEGDDMRDVATNTERLIKTESDTDDVKCFVPLELGGSLEYSMVTIGQDTESTLIKEEQENVPVESNHCGVISNAGSEMDIKQEDQPS